MGLAMNALSRLDEAPRGQDGHLSAEWVRRALVGEADTETVMAVALLHLIDHCPHCGEALAELREDLEPLTATPGLSGGFMAALLKANAELELAQDEDWSALAIEILSLRPEARELLWQEDPRVRSFSLPMALLDRAEAQRHQRPGEARLAAELVLTHCYRRLQEADAAVAGTIRPLVYDLACAASLHLAESHLLGGEREAAERWLFQAELLLDVGSGDAVLLADAVVVRALLAFSEGEAEKALSRLDNASRLLERLQDPERQAIVERRKALVYDYLGDGSAAAQARDRAAALVGRALGTSGERPAGGGGEPSPRRPN